MIHEKPTGEQPVGEVRSDAKVMGAARRQFRIARRQCGCPATLRRQTWCYPDFGPVATNEGAESAAFGRIRLRSRKGVIGAPRRAIARPTSPGDELHRTIRLGTGLGLAGVSKERTRGSAISPGIFEKAADGYAPAFGTHPAPRRIPKRIGCV